MKTLKKLISGALLAVVALTVGSCKNEIDLGDQDLVKQTQGTWMQLIGSYATSEYYYSDEENPATFIFSSDGTFKVTFTVNGTSYQAPNNTYEVNGDKLTLNWVGDINNFYPGWSFVGNYSFNVNQLVFVFDVVDTETGEVIDEGYTWIFYKRS